MRRIGVLMTLGENDPLAQARLTAFAQSLEQFGWGVGRNVKIDYRYGGGNADLIRQHAMELAALSPDVILTTGSVGARAVTASHTYGAHRLHHRS